MTKVYNLSYSISHIATITDAESNAHSDTIIEHILLDSRKVITPASSLFFALKGPRRNGHQFIPELYKKGVRNFVVSEDIPGEPFPEAVFLKVTEPLNALQQLAAFHRQQFSIPVIGITGSNGKTIVKEWLYQLLHEDYNIVRSPKSYNSQIGVPLSIWKINAQHTLAVIEAGISEQGEMVRLEKMIRPTTGILTSIGEAHSEGFIDDEHKFREKVSLFRNCNTVIGREADFEGRREVIEMLGGDINVLTWGTKQDCYFILKGIEKSNQGTNITIIRGSVECQFSIIFTDDASVENAITCCCYLLLLKYDPEVIRMRMAALHPVNMRLELKKGINHCTLINDSYSADLNSLEITLNFLDQQSSNERKTVILSDFLQSSLSNTELYRRITDSLIKHGITRVIAIGEKITAGLGELTGKEGKTIAAEVYPDTNTFLSQFRSSQFKEETILVKGARAFAFEQIVRLLEQKAHQTVLEINLTAIVHNLKQYQQKLKPSVKVMAMVKAFAYGSGGAEIGGILQYHKTDYLGVAYADEGTELRKAGITMPIMVMNPEENAFEIIIDNNLEPEIFSFDMLRLLDNFLKKEGRQQYPVHIEIETGMNRLGFSPADMEELGEFLNTTDSFSIQTVFSHLAASEEPVQDNFTKEQFQLFQQSADKLQQKTGRSFLRHIANSAAAVRHPEMQLDMVRLGIGLYGVDSANSGSLNLQPVTTLKSTVAQIKKLKKGESVSYNRRGVAENDITIATVRIGYADGYPRRLSNGAGKVMIKGKLVSITGTICMDMLMIDITGIDGVQEGDEVILFGASLPVMQVAEWAGTIPYEIMTGVSQRVKRIYFEE